MARAENMLKHHDWTEGVDPEGVYRNWIVEKCRKASMVAEVGVLAGKTTERILRETRAFVVAVDHWKGVPTDPHQSKIYKNLQQSKRNFAQRCGEFYPDRLRVMEMGSPRAASILKKERELFDLVFLDADHRYENVLRDIRAWRGLVRSGGILSGHDIVWPGVRQAVEEELPKTWMRGSGSIWWAVMP